MCLLALPSVSCFTSPMCAGATRGGRAALEQRVAKRRYPMSKVRSGACVAGAAVKRYPMSKVKKMSYPMSTQQDGRHWNGCKEIPHIQGQRRSPSKTIGGMNSHLESNPFLPDMLRGLKQTFCAPGPRGPTETETELCLSVSCGGMVGSDLLQEQGLWVWVWHNPLGGGRH